MRDAVLSVEPEQSLAIGSWVKFGRMRLYSPGMQSVGDQVSGPGG